MGAVCGYMCVALFVCTLHAKRSFAIAAASIETADDNKVYTGCSFDVALREQMQLSAKLNSVRKRWVFFAAVPPNGIFDHYRWHVNKHKRTSAF